MVETILKKPICDLPGRFDSHTIYGLCWEDIHEIEAHDRMPFGVISNIVSKWDCFTPLTINDITFKDGRPFGFQQIHFTNIDRDIKDKFIEFLARISLTHRLMFVESDGGVFVTESEDGQTNIDAELIELLANSIQGE